MPDNSFVGGDKTVEAYALLEDVLWEFLSKEDREFIANLPLDYSVAELVNLLNSGHTKEEIAAMARAQYFDAFAKPEQLRHIAYLSEKKP